MTERPGSPAYSLIGFGWVVCEALYHHHLSEHLDIWTWLAAVLHSIRPPPGIRGSDFPVLGLKLLKA
jgi:hypothetical protein